MAARLNADVFVVLGTDLTQLERGAHLTVQLVLLLCHSNVILGRVVHQETQIGRHARLAVRIQIAAHVSQLVRTFV